MPNCAGAAAATRIRARSALKQEARRNSALKSSQNKIVEQAAAAAARPDGSEGVLRLGSASQFGCACVLVRTRCKHIENQGIKSIAKWWHMHYAPAAATVCPTSDRRQHRLLIASARRGQVEGLCG